MGNVIQVRNEYRKQQWTQIIQKCQSGLTNKEYCRQQGISEKSNYYWLRKLRITTAESMSQIVGMEPPAAVEDKIYIRFRGAELALPSGTNTEAIAAVLHSLQQL